MAGAVERITWTLQTKHKVAQVSDTLITLLGSRASSATADATANGTDAATVDDEDNGRGSTAATAATAALKSCLGVAGDVAKELELWRKELFGQWQAATQQALSAMAAWKDSQLMTFDAKNAHVRTHFSEALVVLLRQVRQLQALGFSVRREILAEVDTANKFYRCGAW